MYICIYVYIYIYIYIYTIIIIIILIILSLIIFKVFSVVFIIFYYICKVVLISLYSLMSSSFVTLAFSTIVQQVAWTPSTGCFPYMRKLCPGETGARNTMALVTHETGKLATRKTPPEAKRWRDIEEVTTSDEEYFSHAGVTKNGKLAKRRKVTV